MEEDDNAVVGQLGGFALEQFLGSFTGEQGISSNSLSAVGLGAGSSSSRSGNAARVDAAQIYGGRFEDEDEDDGGEDWEDEVDREMNEEDMQSSQLMLQLPPASAMPARPPAAAQTLMRGEDEDFDDDDEEDNDDGRNGNAVAGPSTFNHAPLSTPSSAFHLPDASEIMHVKQEEQDLDGVQLQGQRRQVEHQDDHDEEEKIDPQELAAQQALFAQSYARMQAQQRQPMQAGSEEAMPGQRPASPPVMDVKTLYPSFAPDKVLNFTEIFYPKPRKRARIDPNVEVCKSFSSRRQ